MALMAFNMSLAALAGFLLAGSILTGCAGAGEPPAFDKGTFPTNCSFSAIPGATRQLILAAGISAAEPSVRVYLLEKGDEGWKVSFPPIAAVVGRGGFAAPGAKREGDGKTPSGMYPLPFAFGYAAGIRTKMPYRQVTENDVWVDDEASEDYNRWVKKDKTTASSFERLLRRDDLYKYGLVIGYNTRPTTKGHGSAIFVHLWKSKGQATSGCLAMAEEDLLRIMNWLDPKQNPLVSLGTEGTISAIVR
jgi:L,D-peptidoglycan transpeptidase YkuD (ErfK/YbiS/YcfS/YnhG family)